MKNSTNKAASDYTGPERRQAPTMDAIELVFERMLRKHEAREDALWEERLQRLVPNGDFDGHCTYHQTKIDAANAEKEFYQTLKIRVAEVGIIGLLRMIVWLLAIGFGATLAAKFGALPAFLAMVGNK